MTEKQRDAMMVIDIVHEQTAKRLMESYPEGRPTQYVNVETLVRVYHLDRRTIKALIKKGKLVSRESGGWGPEVKIACESGATK